MGVTKHLLNETKAHSISQNLDLPLISGPRSYGYTGNSLKRETATIVLLNGHSVKLAPNDSLSYPQDRDLSTLIRESSFCTR